MALQSATGNVGVVPRELATAMTGIEFLEKLRDGALPAPPFAEVTDIWITEVERGRVVFEAKPSPRFYNPLGSVHGGWIATVLDSAMGCAVHSIMNAGQAINGYAGYTDQHTNATSPVKTIPVFLFRCFDTFAFGKKKNRHAGKQHEENPGCDIMQFAKKIILNR